MKPWEADKIKEKNKRLKKHKEEQFKKANRLINEPKCPWVAYVTIESQELFIGRFPDEKSANVALKDALDTYARHKPTGRVVNGSSDSP